MGCCKSRVIENEGKADEKPLEKETYNALPVHPRGATLTRISSRSRFSAKRFSVEKLDAETFENGDYSDLSLDEIHSWAEKKKGFERLLSNPRGVEFFMEFLRKEHSHENLLFLLECQKADKILNRQIIQNSTKQDGGVINLKNILNPAEAANKKTFENNKVKDNSNNNDKDDDNDDVDANHTIDENDNVDANHTIDENDKVDRNVSEDEFNELKMIAEETESMSSSNEEIPVKDASGEDIFDQEESGKESSKSGGYESEDEKSSLSSEDEAGKKNMIAQKENSYESIDFKNTDITDEEKISEYKEATERIYTSFIIESSPLEVNVCTKVKDKVLNMRDSPPSDVFDEAREQIYLLIYRDSYPRFINSSMYKELLAATEAK